MVEPVNLAAVASPWIVTFTGKQINPLSPTLDLIDPIDIAHGLSILNRYAGQTAEPLSVAQHACYVSALCEEEHGQQCGFEGLHHDDAEYLLGEVTKWLKATPAMADYRFYEDEAQAVIAARLGCNPVQCPAIERADKLMARYEIALCYGQRWNPGPGALEPITADERGYVEAVAHDHFGSSAWAYWPWREAERQFLLRHYRLAK